MKPDLRNTPAFCASNSLAVEWVAIDLLRAPTRRPRTHSKAQIKQIAESILAFRFNNPLLVSDDLEIIAGVARWEAAKQLKLDRVPIVRLSHLDPIQRRAYTIADNKLALNADWNRDLALEIQDFLNFDFDVTKLGFLDAEIDCILDAAQDAAQDLKQGPEDEFLLSDGPAVTKLDDLWIAGSHRLLCGDALNGNAFKCLMDVELADLAFTDPPYNVRIHGHVTGHGRIHHREFAMAAGEMTPADYTRFLRNAFKNVVQCSRNGAIAFICIDWRHMVEVNEAGRGVFSELKNLCVWNKTNGGMGTFYRSKHELIFVFKVGTAPHTNTFGLGNTGRYRTNVWDYAGVNTFKSDRDEELAMHPTCKPVALVADALKDCSRRGEIMLDPFAGSGTTLIAAEKSGRRARLMEIDPRYCDCIVQRYQRFTGESVTLAATGQTFEEASEERRAETPLRETADV